MSKSNNQIGQLIKNYRLNKLTTEGKSWSQLELSLTIGWQNPSTLSRIEKGIVTPSRETVIKIGQALSLTEEECNTLLTHMGYEELAPEINKKYIKEVVSYIRKEISSYNYPIILQLYSGEVIYWNKPMKLIFTKDPNKQSPQYFRNKFLYKNLVELIFDPKYNIRQNIANWEDLVTTFVNNLYTLHQLIPFDERLYKNHILWSKMESFDYYWEKAKATNPQEHKLYNIDLSYKLVDIGIINFKITTSFLYNDKRFVLQQLIPTDVSDNIKLEQYYKTSSIVYKLTNSALSS